MSDSISRIYADVPDAHCKGLCQKACGPIAASAAERRAIEAKHDTFPTVGFDLVCSKLVDGRCSIYEDRPLICRVYGTTRLLRCPYGCQPAGGFIRERAVSKLFDRINKITAL